MYETGEAVPPKLEITVVAPRFVLDEIEAAAIALDGVELSGKSWISSDFDQIRFHVPRFDAPKDEKPGSSSFLMLFLYSDAIEMVTRGWERFRQLNDAGIEARHCQYVIPEVYMYQVMRLWVKVDDATSVGCQLDSLLSGFEVREVREYSKKIRVAIQEWMESE
jgi:hypothetical protein